MRIKLIGILICLIYSSINAQKNEKNEQELIGKWLFTKTVDNDNNQVEFIKRIGHNGEEMRIVAKGPEIIINQNGTYIKKFTEENSDNGNWKLISEKEIEYEMVIPKNSRQGKLIVLTQKVIDKKWRKDKEGNYLDTSIDKIISLTKSEMKIEYEKNYVMIYKKETK